MISAMGITVSVHECNVRHTKTVSFDLFGMGSGDNTCSACVMEEKQEKCNMPSAKNDNSCCNDNGDNTANAINVHADMQCCIYFTEYVQAKFDAVLIQKSINNFKILLHFIKSVKLFDLSQFEVISNTYQSLDGGLSPPYTSDYIQFISSQLE